MQEKIGVGSSLINDPYRAGCQAVERALSQLSGQHPNLILLFSTQDLNLEQILSGARSVAGENIQIIGGSSSGVIMTNQIFTKGVAAMAMSVEDIEAITGAVSNTDDDTEIKVSTLMQTMDKQTKTDAEGRNQLVVSLASVHDKPGAAEEIVRRMGKELEGGGQLVGGFTSGEENRSTFLNGEVQTRGIANAALFTPRAVGVGVKHGYTPFGHPRIVTKSRDNIIYELDNKPIMEAYAEELPFQNLTIDKFREHAINYPLGVPQDSGEYLIRDPYMVHPDGSVEIPVPIPEQTTVQIMFGDRKTLILAAKEAAYQAKRQLKGEPLLAFVFSCATRLSYLGIGVKVELLSIQTVIGVKTPVIGLFSYGEIAAPQKDNARLHNKTVVVGLIGK